MFLKMTSSCFVFHGHGGSLFNFCDKAGTSKIIPVKKEYPIIIPVFFFLLSKKKSRLFFEMPRQQNRGGSPPTGNWVPLAHVVIRLEGGGGDSPGSGTVPGDDVGYDSEADTEPYEDSPDSDTGVYEDSPGSDTGAYEDSPGRSDADASATRDVLPATRDVMAAARAMCGMRAYVSL